MTTRSALLAAMVAVLSWGVAVVIERAVLDHLPPVTLFVVQLLVSATVLWGAVLIRGVQLPPLRQALRLAGGGIVQPGIANLLFILGLARTSAGVFSLIASSEILVSVGLARYLLGERAGRTVSIYALIGTIGLGLVAVGEGSRGGHRALIGIVLTALGALAAGLYGIIGKRASATGTDTVLITALHQTAGLAVGLIVWPFALATGESARLSEGAGRDWALAALTGLLVYALPFWLFIVAWTKLPVATVATLLCGEAPVAIAAGTLFRRERYGWTQWIGAAIGVVAVLGVARSHADQPDQPAHVTVG